MADKICYSNNGMSIRYVPGDYVAQAGEVLFNNTPTSEQLENAFAGYEDEVFNTDIKRQIAELENSITARRRDEAILGEDGGWLAGVRGVISDLREQLK